MAKRIFILILAVLSLVASPAWAGPKPPDMPAYTQVVPAYETANVHNVPIDARVTPPTRGLADIPSTDPGWINTFAPLNENIAGNYELCFADGGAAAECKFRTICNAGFTAKDDPLRNYGQPGSAHDHLFFGARKVNAWTTYRTLRTQKASNCAGGIFNNTAYWMPLIKKTMSGAAYGVIPKYITVYYANNYDADPHRVAHLGRGIGFVTGSEMDDDWGWLKTILSNTNAAVVAGGGAAGRYTLPPQGASIICGNNVLTDLGQPSSRWFKNANGTDPWEGRCTSDKDFVVQFDASECWDGQNLWSPSGYHHVIPRVLDNRYGERICPKNYYQTVSLIVRALYMHGGFADYGTWSCSSDAGYQTVVNAGSNPHTIGTCESNHADWKDGWDGTTRFAQETNCGAVEGGRGHLCAAGTFSATQGLISTGAAPDGSRNPQVTCQADDCDTRPDNISKMWKAPTTTVGPHNHLIHGANDNLPNANDNDVQLAGVTPLDWHLHAAGH